jgi:hypothetical protein
MIAEREAAQRRERAQHDRMWEAMLKRDQGAQEVGGGLHAAATPMHSKESDELNISSAPMMLFFGNTAKMVSRGLEMLKRMMPDRCAEELDDIHDFMTNPECGLTKENIVEMLQVTQTRCAFYHSHTTQHTTKHKHTHKHIYIHHNVASHPTGAVQDARRKETKEGVRGDTMSSTHLRRRGTTTIAPQHQARKSWCRWIPHVQINSIKINVYIRAAQGSMFLIGRNSIWADSIQLTGLFNHDEGARGPVLLEH